MQVVINPDKKDWAKLLQRPYYDNSAVLEAAQTVLNEVRQNGDEALRKFSRNFDGIDIDNFVSWPVCSSAGGQREVKKIWKSSFMPYFCATMKQLAHLHHAHTCLQG